MIHGNIQETVWFDTANLIPYDCFTRRDKLAMRFRSNRLNYWLRSVVTFKYTATRLYSVRHSFRYITFFFIFDLKQFTALSNTVRPLYFFLSTPFSWTSSFPLFWWLSFQYLFWKPFNIHSACMSLPHFVYFLCLRLFFILCPFFHALVSASFLSDIVRDLLTASISTASIFLIHLSVILSKFQQHTGDCFL